MIRQPYGVQKAAFNAAQGKRGFNFYMEQGLGKTGVVLTEFAQLVAEGLATRLVVFCPNSFKKGWEDEAKEWGFDFDFYLFQSGDEWGQNQFLKKNYTKPPVVVINYEGARPKIIPDPADRRKKKVIWNDGMKFIDKFVEGRKCYLAIDESIQISGHDSLQTVGVDLLADKFQYVRNLSGKPIKQGPHDLFSQLRVIRAINMNYYVFKNLFCKMGGFKGKVVEGAMNEEGLAAILDPVTFRATKADWTDLPPKVYNIREYELTPEQKKQYKAMHDDFILWLNEEEYVSIDAALTKYIKLAQIQAGFIFDADKNVRPLVDPAKNPRLALLETILRDEVPGKAIVVYNHKPVRNMLAERFEKLRPVFIHGGMTDDEISESKRCFNTQRDHRVIFITKAAKYGHTLLGNQDRVEDACSDMVFYENTYHLDDRSQLEDRAHRHGQEQEFMRYWDLAGTPLDRDAVKALARKESIFQAVFAPLRKTGR